MPSCRDLRSRRSALPELAAEMCDAVVPGARLRCSGALSRTASECQSHCWRQGGASFASFACGAAFEGLQCDFLLLAYWTHLFALNDEERHNGRHFLHIFSHAVYHVLQTILTTLWLGTRCSIPSLCCAPVPRTELSSCAQCTVGVPASVPLCR